VPKAQISESLIQSNEDLLKRLDQHQSNTSNKTAEQLMQLLLAKQLAIEENQSSSEGFCPLAEVQRLTGGKSRSTIYRWSRDGILPPPRKIGPNSIAWLRSEIDAWINKFQGAA
jgi:prophage regulatory protein